MVAAALSSNEVSGEASSSGSHRPLQKQRIALTEELAGFGGSDAGVGGETVEVVETGAGRPLGERGFAELGEMLLEAVENGAGVGIARRNGATRAGIAALESDFTDGEADDAALVVTEETIFPEGGQRFATGGAERIDIDFESRAETLAGFVQGNAGEPFADGLERGGGDDGGAVGDGVVWKTAGGIANDNLLIEENT